LQREQTRLSPFAFDRIVISYGRTSISAPCTFKYLGTPKVLHTHIIIIYYIYHDGDAVYRLFHYVFVNGAVRVLVSDVRRLRRRLLYWARAIL